MSKKNTVQIVDPADVRSLVNKYKDRSSDIKSRLGPVLKELWIPDRKLKIARMNRDFLKLRSVFPQFSEVIDFVSKILMSRQKMGLYFKMPPILLHGHPGLGKTFFTQALAEALRLQFDYYDLSNASASFIFTGASVQWSEGEPGLLCKHVAKTKIANSIFVLDEIDKINHGNYSPIHCLLSVLEAHTARQFRDESLDIKVDLSHINWIATANDIDMVSTPLRSRFRPFEIRYPDPREMEPVIQMIYQALLLKTDLKLLLSFKLKASVVEALRYQTPREIRMMLEAAVYNAISENRRHLTVTDLVLPTKSKKAGIGFLR